jgi:DNA-binding transcriptional MerR regulator
VGEVIRGMKTKVLCRYLGISRPLLNYYVRSKLVSGPSISKGKKGKGHSALWSFEDVVELKTIRKLRQLELPIQRIRKVISWLRFHGYALDTVILEVAGDTILAHDQQGRIFDVLREQGQGIFLYWSGLVQEAKRDFKLYSELLAA